MGGGTPPPLYSGSPKYCVTHYGDPRPRAILCPAFLAKEHSAADWSTRPLPQSWLVYAALDVELLPELRDKIGEILDAAGKTQIAEEEFTAVLRRETPVREEPWRRLSCWVWLESFGNGGKANGIIRKPRLICMLRT